MMTQLTAQQWREFIDSYPNAHIMQTAGWGSLKAAFGWDVAYLQKGSNGAQVLFRRLPLGFSLAYVPKGPLGPDWTELLPELHALCRTRRAVLLKVEPDSWQLDDNTFFERQLPGFAPSSHVIQPPRTIVVDLTGSEDDMLARMKQKTRYNIRLAEKKGVRVKISEDIDSFYEMMLETGERDEFGVHSLPYYRRAYDLFHPAGACELLMAEYQGEPLAALMVFYRGERAWYFYGASSEMQRNLMPTYLLQWEAMRWARRKGCTSYDLWGVPDAEEEDLEANFTDRSDGLWGVYRFKRGYGGALLRAAGAWDYVYYPSLYRLYRWWISYRGI
jgi:peptidoglycan pentaglycine glycine transferase (the first glycine)